MYQGVGWANRQELYPLASRNHWFREIKFIFIFTVSDDCAHHHTSAANTVVSYFNGMGLVASFQFNINKFYCDMEDRNTPHRLFWNVAYQLARSNNNFKRHLLEAISKCGTGVLTSRKQLHKLIIEPISKTLGSSLGLSAVPYMATAVYFMTVNCTKSGLSRYS